MVVSGSKIEGMCGEGGAKGKNTGMRDGVAVSCLLVGPVAE